MSARRASLWSASIVILVGAWQGGAAVAQPADQVGTSSGQALEEIVVTAQRREERSQSVPIAITAFTSERLQQQNITTAQDLNGLVPSLLVSPIGQATRDVEAYTMRGVGPTYLGASAVVVYLAEVPLPAAYTTNRQGGPGNYVDLDNLEVLAGPQGTLFGRNTTGGAALLVPHKPTNDFGGYVQVSGGNYSYNAVEGVVNIPVVGDKLLVRASGTYQDRGGFTHDIVWNKDRDDKHYLAGRLGVTFRPTDSIENYLLAYGSYSSDNGPGWVNGSIDIPALMAAGQCSGSCALDQQVANLVHQLGPRATAMGVDEFEKTRSWGLINKTTFDLTDDLTLNNIVSYQSLWNNYAYDGDGLPLQLGDDGTFFPTFRVPLLSRFGIAPNGFSNSAAYGPRDDLRQITEEIQLQGKIFDDRLTYSTGFFYYDLAPNGDQLNRAVFDCPAATTGTCTPTFQTYGVSNESKAVYAQGTLDLGIFSQSLENLRLTGGFRYTWDTIDGTTNFHVPLAGGLSYCINTATVASNPSACSFGATLQSSAPTWTVGLDYKPIDDVLLYAKISRGYKSGGFNVFAVRVSTRVFDPEYVTSYEAGVKSDWHLGTIPLRLNLTGYRSDYSNIQIFTGDFNNGASGARVVNQSAQIQGFEAEANVRPIEALELGGNVGYTDARYTTGCVADCGAFPAPEWTYNLHGTFDLPVPEEWGKVSLYASYSFVGRYVQQQHNEPGGILDSHGLLNLSAKWQDIAQSNVDLELFATNVTNQLYRITNSGTSGSGFDAAIYGEPQMYGARVRYRFGSEATEHTTSTSAYAPPPVQPATPAPSIPKTYMVFFDFNKSDLTPQAAQIVGSAAENALLAKVTEITVTGHTDTVGSDAYNMRLSRRRAESVAAELEKDGVPSSEIAIVAKGKRDLLVPTDDGVREPQNRRVQIVYENGASS